MAARRRLGVEDAAGSLHPAVPDTSKPKLPEPERAESLDALALIDAAGTESTLDELARRARAGLANPAPGREDRLAIVQHFRAQRAAWGQKQLEKKYGKGDEDGTDEAE